MNKLCAPFFQPPRPTLNLFLPPFCWPCESGPVLTKTVFFLPYASFGAELPCLNSRLLACCCVCLSPPALYHPVSCVDANLSWALHVHA